MKKLVTIALPVYKRLDYVVSALQSIAEQDYPNIELIVSDNGENGSLVKDLADQWYPRPYRFRQNPSTLPLPIHYNQLIEAATGEYFAFLDYDDVISPNYVSELVRILDDHPDVAVALSREEIVDPSGRILRASSADMPERFSGPDFLRSWTMYGYESYATVLGRTAYIKADGGHPFFPGGTYTDDAILIKLCLRGAVGISQRCVFRWRWSEISHGWSLKCASLAEDTRRFLRFLDRDPAILRYQAKEPKEWLDIKKHLFRMAWHTYYERWAGLYRERMPPASWVRAGFAMPFIRDYYGMVSEVLWYAVKGKCIKCIKRLGVGSRGIDRSVQ
ncbi:glycosyltransferase family 2 protein [Nitrospira tepida]|nr:glycosyltransferase family 2 protein [Nitrospira tepida]